MPPAGCLPLVVCGRRLLIAEFLKISYLDVITMAVIPTILYYFSILTMVELDAAKYGGGGELLVPCYQGILVPFRLPGFDHCPDAPRLLARFGRLLGDPAGDRRHLFAARYGALVRALAEGTTGVLGIAAACATAGIIVGVTTLTGLAQRFADIIIGYAQGNLVLTALFSKRWSASPCSASPSRAACCASARCLRPLCSFAAGILLVFPELIAAIVGLAGLPFAYPHAIAFVLAAIGVLMQWMWSEPAKARMS
jgi:hypothetical protein